MTKTYLMAITILFLLQAGALGSVIDFESDNSFTLSSEEFIYAGDQGGFFSSGNGAFLGYHYTDPWDYWGGFAVSNRTEIGEDDLYHQFTSTPGTDNTIGAGGTYAIGYEDWETGMGCVISFVEAQDVGSAAFVNVAWATEYIQENYGQEDYFHLVVTAYDSELGEIGSRTIDMTSMDEWTVKNLEFEDVSALGITMQTSDSWTPLYFCIDDISTETVPEPSIMLALMAAVSGLAGVRKLRKEK